MKPHTEHLEAVSLDAIGLLYVLQTHEANTGRNLVTEVIDRLPQGRDKTTRQLRELRESGRVSFAPQSRIRGQYGPNTYKVLRPLSLGGN